MRHNLKVFRTQQRLTQSQMAEKLGVSLSTYNLIEQGKRRGSQQFWQDLQKAYDLADSTTWQLQQLS